MKEFKKIDIIMLKFTRVFIIVCIGVFFIKLASLEGVDTAMCVVLMLVFSGLSKEVGEKIAQLEESKK